MTSPPADTPSAGAAAGSATVDQDRLPGGPGDSPSYLSHRQILIVLAGVMAGMLLFALDQGIVGTALPRIVSELGGLDQLSWVVTAYLLTSTATTPLWGKISDLYGRRLIFQVAIVIFLIGSALSGLGQNMPQLILFRAVQGVGGGGLFAIAFSIIGDVIPPRERGRYQGYFGAVFGVSSRGRAAAGRLADRQIGLALDLLHQHPRRPGRAGGHLGRPQDAGDPPPALDRLPGRRRHRRGRHLPAAVPGLAGQYSECAGKDVGAAARKDAERGIGSGNPGRDLVERSVASETDHYVDSSPSGVLREAGCVAAAIGLEHLHLVALRQCTVHDHRVAGRH